VYAAGPVHAVAEGCGVRVVTPHERPWAGLHVLPVELAEANAFVAVHHRHHKPTIGHRFSIGVADTSGALHGVAIAGRPVARLTGHPRDVLEVVRLATDGTPNACSMLYGACARAARAMGFRRIQTYTLPSEGGASLRASGWVDEGAAGGGQWEHTDGRPRRTDQPTGVKNRWALTFPRPAIDVIPVPALDSAPTLWKVAP